MQILKRLFLLLIPYWKTLIISAVLLVGRAGLELVPPLFQKEIIDEVKSVLTKETEFRSISVDVKVSEDLPPFESDRGKLEQIFFNLFNNAIGRMGDGGHLEFSARREDAKFISIAFSDNGPGVPPDLRDKIFTPFFTTKKAGQGTGQGLPFSHRIIS